MLTKALPSLRWGLFHTRGRFHEEHFKMKARDKVKVIRDELTRLRPTLSGYVRNHNAIARTITLEAPALTSGETYNGLDLVEFMLPDQRAGQSDFEELFSRLVFQALAPELLDEPIDWGPVGSRVERFVDGRVERLLYWIGQRPGNTLEIGQGMLMVNDRFGVKDGVIHCQYDNYLPTRELSTARLPIWVREPGAVGLRQSRGRPARAGDQGVAGGRSADRSTLRLACARRHAQASLLQNNWGSRYMGQGHTQARARARVHEAGGRRDHLTITGRDMRKLLAFAGKAGSGKDTAADYLGSEYGFMKIAFADPLRLAAHHIFGVDHHYFTDRKLKEEAHPDWGMSPRRMLQLLGNEAMKPVFGSDVWIKRWQMTYNIVRDTDDVSVSDVRFDVEADAVRALGGVVIHITRPDAGLKSEAGGHVSESGVTAQAGDIHLVNDGTLADLRDKLDDIFWEVTHGTSR